MNSAVIYRIARKEKTRIDKYVRKEQLDEATNVGLYMNYTKTQFIINTQDADETILIPGNKIKYTETYIYLRQAITLCKQNQELDINKRIRLGWAAYGKLEHIFSVNIPMYLK